MPDLSQPSRSRRVMVVGFIAVVVAAASFIVWRRADQRRGSASGAPDSTIVQTIRADDLEIVLRSPDAVLRQGRNTFTIEFRRPGADALVDVGTVRASANMPMPGMVMSGGLQVTPSGVPGRYEATAEFGMAGAWQMAIEWNGPAGQGSVNFQGSVQ